MPRGIEALRRFAVGRSLFDRTTLAAALERFRFVQAPRSRLPLLWRDRVIGWGNLAVADGGLHAGIGYVSGRAPRDRAFKNAIEEELERLRTFLESK